MTIVRMIDSLCKWADERICSRISLKEPPESGKPDDTAYEYKRVRPSVFPLFIQTKERLPEDINAPVPSLCVQLVGGSDSWDEFRTLDVSFALHVWNPGVHPKDWLYGSGEKKEKAFKNSADGWRDLWNFADVALEEIESVNDISGMRIVKEEPVRFALYSEQDSIPDLYPLWFAHIDFKVSARLQRNNIELMGLL